MTNHENAHSHLDAAKEEVKDAAAVVVEEVKEKIHEAVESVASHAHDSVDKVHTEEPA
jgi:hypothetical protein